MLKTLFQIGLIAIIWVSCPLSGFGQIDLNYGNKGIALINYSVNESQCTHFDFDAKGETIALGRMNFSLSYDRLFVSKIDTNGKFYQLGQNEYKFLPPLGKSQVPFDLKVNNTGVFILYTELFDTNYQGQVLKLSSALSIDSTFGIDGRFNFPMVSNEDVFFSQILIGSNNEIFISGGINVRTDTSRKGLLVKLNPNGVLDSTFGQNGKVIYDINKNEFPDLVTIEASNQLFMVEVAPNAKAIVLTKRNSFGLIDSSFGLNGTSKILSAIHPFAKKIIIDKDNKIVVAFHVDGISNTPSNLLMRMDTSGQLDNGFGKNGLVKTFENSKFNNSAIIDLRVNSEGKYLLAFSSITNSNKFLGAMQFNKNGILDSSFVDNGLLYDKSFNATAMHIDNTDRLLFSGKKPDFNLARYNANKLITKTIQLDKVQFNIYPNPNNGVFVINMPHSELIYSYKIFGLNGQLVQHGQIGGVESNYISCSNGVYVIQVYTENLKLIGTQKMLVN